MPKNTCDFSLQSFDENGDQNICSRLAYMKVTFEKGADVEGLPDAMVYCKTHYEAVEEFDVIKKGKKKPFTAEARRVVAAYAAAA